MDLPKEGSLLRIFIGESDCYAGIAALRMDRPDSARARPRRSDGAPQSRRFWRAKPSPHRQRYWISTDLPIVVEIVDTAEKIEAFLALIDVAIRDGLAIMERVQIRFYRVAELDLWCASAGVVVSNVV